MKETLARGEYHLVDNALSRTKLDVWKKFGVIIECFRAEVLTLNMASAIFVLRRISGYGGPKTPSC